MALKSEMLNQIYIVANAIKARYLSTDISQIHIVAALIEQSMKYYHTGREDIELNEALDEIGCTKENLDAVYDAACKWLSKNQYISYDDAKRVEVCFDEAVRFANFFGEDRVNVPYLISEYVDHTSPALIKILMSNTNGNFQKIKENRDKKRTISENFEIESVEKRIKNKSEEQQEKINDESRDFKARDDEPEAPKINLYAPSNVIPIIKKIQNHLREKVYGQDEAISTVVSGYFNSVMTYNKNNTGNQRPKAVFLFAGAPGVGKTYLANAAAEAIGVPFHQFDMSSFSDKEAPLEFAGSDRVFKSSHEGLVTGFVRQNPRCVLLFDEIEKAHINIIHLFLQILDAGCLKDSFTGTNVSFKDAIIIMTTNAGKKLYENLEPGNPMPNRKTVVNAITNDVNPYTGEKFFPEAICSRFAAGNVVLFNPLGAKDLLRIGNSAIKASIDALANKFKISIESDSNLCAALLFAEGGRVDARALNGRVTNFVAAEVYNWMKFASEKDLNALSSLKKMEIRIGDNSEYQKMFKPVKTQNVLLFSENEGAYSHLKSNKSYKLFNVKTIEEAYKVINDKEVVFAICDIFGTEAPTLNVEDTESEGRKFVDVLVKERIPAFVYSSEKHKINNEERLALIGCGVSGFVEQEDKADKIKAICEGVYIDNKLRDLARSRKALSFDCIYELEGDTGVIELSDLRLVPVVDVEDKDDVADVCMTDVSFEDVIGADDAKAELKGFISYLKEPRLYTKNKIPVPKGVILYGPPGTGKTMLAKAFAHESGATFIATQGNSFLSGIRGDGAQEVKRIFNLARKYAPAVLFIDEFDIIAKDRFKDNTAEDIVNALLNEMDGFATNSSRPVFVLAATNYDVSYGKASALDAALLRRFDRRIFVDLPSADERKQFIEGRLKKSGQSLTKAAIKSVVSRSIGMSLSDLGSVIDFALRGMVQQGLAKLNEDFFNEAFETYRFGEKIYWSEDSLKRVAIHETGHALVNYKSGNKPSYITISSRGSFGGYVQIPQEDVHLYTKNQLLSKIRGALAGRAAELVFYGEEDGISTGAAHDIEQATNTALQMITVYGMVEEYGIMSTKNTEAAAGLCNKILADELKNAKDIVSKNKEKINKIVEILLEKNHLMGDKLEEFFQDLA